MLDEIISNTPIGGFTTKVKTGDGIASPLFCHLVHWEAIL